METTMASYTADFRTDADYAIHSFKARSPQHALRKARVFYDEHPEELMFTSYDGGHPVNEISVRSTGGDEVALWQNDDFRMRLAARDMLDALELCVDCLAELARLDDGTPSISALNQARAAIASAKGAATSRTNTTRQLPAGPQTTNADRTEWAASALRHFQCRAGCDYEDALGDLLCDLMHWSGRNNFDFETPLCRARGHYGEEKAPERS
jgi:hypothetical protein